MLLPLLLIGVVVVVVLLVVVVMLLVVVSTMINSPKYQEYGTLAKIVKRHENCHQLR
jgi:uncharacterized protein HemY